jgi:(4S)-4-hydroxy-5-phosphonooxypentane-2,3-dione isomerase
MLYTIRIQARSWKKASMFSLVVQLEVRPGSREEFLAGMTANAELSVRDEAGCLRFDVCSVDGDENRFVLYELYVDADAFAAHKQTPHFQAWREVADRVVAAQLNTPGVLLATNSAEVAA